MICVDTSVWITALRQGKDWPDGHLGGLVTRRQILLPVPVRIELLAGTGQGERERVLKNLSALTPAHPTATTWQRVERWCFRSADARQYFSFADLLIAALAAEVEAPVWSSDRAFERMERLGFIRCYRPRR